MRSTAGLRPAELSWRHLLTCVLAGLVAAGAVLVSGQDGLAFLVGWSVAAGTLLLWAWRTGWRSDADQLRPLAHEEGRTRVTDATVLWATVLSLAAVVEGLVRPRASGPLGVSTVLVSIFAVVLGWALVNTVFAFKYARCYYTGGEGDIDFGQSEPPAYSDFAYIAFSVGMSFVMPDTRITSTAIRRVALGHALLSYLFGTVVVAIAIDLVSTAA